MLELNQNKKLTTNRLTRFYVKTFFILEINHIQRNYLYAFYKMVVLKVSDNLRQRYKLSWVLMRK